MQDSYEFDPCQFDEPEATTIDNWKPSAGKTNNIVKSEWRQLQNAGRCNLEPGIDDLKKIEVRLKNKFPDSQIMDEFGITAETLVAIKRGCYCPIEGISLDNLSKIYKEFSSINIKIDKKIEKVFKVFAFLHDNVVPKKHKEKFKSITKNKQLKKVIEEILDDEDEEI
jgi:hypothetical protein